MREHLALQSPEDRGKWMDAMEKALQISKMDWDARGMSTFFQLNDEDFKRVYGAAEQLQEMGGGDFTKKQLEEVLRKRLSIEAMQRGDTLTVARVLTDLTPIQFGPQGAAEAVRGTDRAMLEEWNRATAGWSERVAELIKQIPAQMLEGARNLLAEAQNVNVNFRAVNKLDIDAIFKIKDETEFQRALSAAKITASLDSVSARLDDHRQQLIDLSRDKASAVDVERNARELRAVKETVDSINVNLAKYAGIGLALFTLVNMIGIGGIAAIIMWAAAR